MAETSSDLWGADTVRQSGQAGRLALRSAAFGLAACAVWSLTSPARAESIIERPGARPMYSVELDPHVLAALGGPVWADDGFGLGFRASIPIVDDPIKTINNNMAIGFGLDWAHYGEKNRCWDYYHYRYDYDCDANALWFPVVLQWNFWLTDIISVYGEPGIAIRHWRWEYPCAEGNWAGLCDRDDTDFLPLVFYAGGRFLFSERFGLNVRIGFWPSMLNVGASILL